MIFRTFFLLFKASVRSRPPGPPAVPGVSESVSDSDQGSTAVICRREEGELDVFMPRGGSSVVRIAEVIGRQEKRSSLRIDEYNEDIEATEDDYVTSESEAETIQDNDNLISESSLVILPVKYQYTFAEVGFLFYKLVQLVNKRFEAVSKRMKDKLEKEERKFEMMRMRKTNLEVDKIVIQLNRRMEVNAMEEKEKIMENDIFIARAAFSEWRQIARRDVGFSRLRMIKRNLVKDFFLMCDLELIEMVREIHL